MRGWTLGMMALGLLLAAGCEQKDEQPAAAPPRERTVPAASPRGDQPASVETQPREELPPPTIPEVNMTEEQAQTNVVQVDAVFPPGELPDLKGQTQSIEGLRGEKLTVVVFWTLDNPYSVYELSDLQADVVDKFGEKGAAVVGIHVGGEADAVRAKVEELKVQFPVLLDAESAYFPKVATAHLPRTYLLDAAGKVLWFDLEYVPTTRDELLQSIQVALGETGK